MGKMYMLFEYKLTSKISKIDIITSRNLSEKKENIWSIVKIYTKTSKMSIFSCL
jgi:hypothetical protein